MAAMLKALIFDVDGTLADTEEAHRMAFNQAFAQLGRDWHWDLPTYTQLLDVAGGKERILRYWRQVQPDLMQIDSSALQDEVATMHTLKTAIYERAVQDGQVHLRPGVLRLIGQAQQAGVRLAIATTTSAVNVVALLRAAIGPDWQHYFSVIEDASTAQHKKPHPQVYLQVLQRLQLQARDCLVLEDSSNGLRAALSAGLATLVTPNSFTAHNDFTGALRVLPDLQATNLVDLRALHRMCHTCAPASAPH
ncbi:MAG: HAD-IA family hydrolase [Rhodoferax sp.]